MRSKKEIENELRSMRGQIASLRTKSASEAAAINEKVKAEDAASSMLTLYKVVLESNRQTQMLLKQLSANVETLATEIGAGVEEEYQSDAIQDAPAGQARELPISGLDAKIIQFIQVKGMTCADDIKSQMSYKGRNAASARLNRLYKQGLLERYQLGHKVYYKYDAGKATNLLIVSPPQ